MNPSHHGDHEQNSSLVGVGQNMQVMLQQREELRRMRAIIEDAERRMDFGMAEQMQQFAFGQAPQRTETRYSAGPLTLPYAISAPIPPVLQGTARIVEVESDSSSPARPSTIFPTSLTINTASHPAPQEYSQLGQSYMNSSQQGHPNLAGPSIDHLTRPVATTTATSRSGFFANQHAAVPSGSDYRPSPPTWTNMDSQRQYEQSNHFQAPQRRATNENYYREHTHDNTSNLQVQWHSTKGPLPPVEPQDAPISQLTNYGQSAGQLEQLYVQPTSSNGQTQVGVPSQFLPFSQMHGTYVHHTRPGTQNTGHFQNAAQGSRFQLGRQGQGRMVVPSADTQMASNRPSRSAAYTIGPGLGQMPIRRGNQSGTEVALVQASDTSVLPGDPGGIALTQGFGPAQAAPQPNSNHDYLNHKNSMTSPDASTSISGVAAQQGASTGTDVSNHVVPVSSSSTAPSTLSIDPANAKVSSPSMFPALSNLNELLAGYDRWNEDATSRILGLDMKAPNGRSSPANVPLPQETTTAQNDAPSTLPNGTTSTIPQSSSAQRVTEPPLQTPMAPTSPQTQLEQIINSHNTPSVDGGDTASATPARQAHGGQVSTPLSSGYPNSPARPNKWIIQPLRSSLPAAASSSPRTPAKSSGATMSTPSSANANRKTLAKDILRALGPPSAKRKRDMSNALEGTESDLDNPSIKKSKVAPNVDPTESASGQAPLPQGVGRVGETSTASSSGTRPNYPAPQQQHQYTQQAPPKWSFIPSFQSLQSQPGMARGTMWQQGSGFSGVQPYQWGPQTWAQTAQPSRPIAQQPAQYQVYQTHSVANNSNSTVNSSIWRPVSQPIPAQQNPALPSKVVPSRPPLFLSSSESPPPSQPQTSISPLKRPRRVAFVEIGTSLATLKHRRKGAQSPTTPTAGSSTATMGVGSGMNGDVFGSVDSLFGKPTGVLATASATPVRIRPSKSGVHVLIPRVDTSAWYKDRAQKKQNKAVITRDDDEEDVALVQDFTRRLVRRPCLWKKCGAVLDSCEKLSKHVKVIHGEQTEDKLYKCRWTECASNRWFADSELLIRHLQWHVTNIIYCGYEECRFRTQRASQLTEHVVNDHDAEEVMRPYAVPFDLVQPEVPLMVETLPAYMSIPLQVSGRPITADRHQKIGPWVLHRIFGKVNMTKGAVRAAVPLRSQRLAKQPQPAQVEDVPESTQGQFRVQDDYDFLRAEVPMKGFARLMSPPLVIDETEEADADIGVDASLESSRPVSPPRSASPSASIASERGDAATRDVTEDPLMLLPQAEIPSSSKSTQVRSIEEGRLVSPIRVVREAHEAEEVEDLL